MIRVFHLTRAAPQDEMVRIMLPGIDRTELARRLFKQGHYELVAEVDCDEFEVAYRCTNNLDNSWSIEPPACVKPVMPNYHQHGDERFGKRSSMIGDIFELNGNLTVCDTYGFALLAPL